MKIPLFAFAFFLRLTKNKEQQMKKLADVIKGMYAKDWEVRENCRGRKVVYVRFHEKPKTGKLSVEA